MAEIRFHNRVKKTVRVLRAEGAREAKRLFDYAKSCATADMRIELVLGGQIVQTHWVDYVEHIPTIREVRAASPDPV